MKKHVCMIRSPDTMIHVGRGTRLVDGKPISIKYGISKHARGPVKATTYEVSYDASKWSDIEARAHCCSVGGLRFEAVLPVDLSAGSG